MSGRSRTRTWAAMLAVPLLLAGALLALYGRELVPTQAAQIGSAVDQHHDNPAVLQGHVRAESDQAVGNRASKLRSLLVLAHLGAASSPAAGVALLSWFVRRVDRRIHRPFAQATWLALRAPPTFA